MTKKELAAQVAARSGLSKAAALRVIGHLVDITLESLGDGHVVHLTGLCSFRPVRRSARNWINPRTGRYQLIPARNRLHVCVAKAAQEAV